jgi:hypothetical protein
MPDGYYRSLIKLPSDRLLALLNELQDEASALSDAVYKKALKDAGEEGDEGQDEDEPEPEAEELSLVELDPSVIPTLYAATSLMERQMVCTGPGTPVVKVYFTTRDASGFQRGFCPCSATAACKWMGVHLAESQTHFCAHMYAWYLISEGMPGMSKADHLSVEPDEEVVRSLMPDLQLTPW